MISERAQGELILDRMADDSGLALLRRELAVLYQRRRDAEKARGGGGPDWTNAFVSADDARRLMLHLGIRFTCNSRLGALFRSKEWAPTGYRIRSETLGAHGRKIETWRLK